MIIKKMVYNNMLLGNKNKMIIYSCDLINNKKYFINHFFYLINH